MTTLSTEQPTEIQPGVHTMPAADYHKIRACSQTALNVIRTSSPAHWKAIVDGDRITDTDAKVFGSAAHAAILEEEEFKAKYVALPEGDGRSKEIRQAKAELEAQGLEPLKPQELAAIKGMRESIYRHKAARFLLESEGQREATLVWREPSKTEDDRRTECLNKARVDHHVTAKKIKPSFVDLKTTQCARFDMFVRSVAKYGYPIQAAQYLRGGSHLNLGVEQFVIIAVEKVAPYAVGVFTFEAGDLLKAFEARDKLFKKYAHCAHYNKWPAYDEMAQSIRMHDYDLRQMEAINE